MIIIKKNIQTFSFVVLLAFITACDEVVRFDTAEVSTNPSVVILDAPSSISLLSPSVTPAYDDMPTFTVGGVKSGDTVKIFTDSACLNEIGSAVSTGVTVSVVSSISLSVGLHTIYTNRREASTSSCSGVSVDYQRLSCPSGYIRVPANGAVGANNNFCVMKYEAKAWNDANADGNVDNGELHPTGCEHGGCVANHKPFSSEEGIPWRDISQEDAWDECDSLNTENDRASVDNDNNSDGTYALISNPEWMAIARNVEMQSTNWTDGNVASNGGGCLKRGNIGASLACTGGDSGYNGADPEGGTSRNPLASLTLDNGEVIWDLSGNVWEWTDWTLGSPLVQVVNKAYVLADGDKVSSFRDFFDLGGNIGGGDEMPPSSWEATNSDLLKGSGIGAYFSGTGSGGAAARGGQSNESVAENTGVFTLFLLRPKHVGYGDIGFRCVFRLPD